MWKRGKKQVYNYIIIIAQDAKIVHKYISI